MKPPGLCPCCGTVTQLTRHHIHPVRHYGKKGNNHVFLLCAPCHQDLERYIPAQKMPHAFYQVIMDAYVERLSKLAREKQARRLFDG